jgi:hypothetical protein
MRRYALGVIVVLLLALPAAAQARVKRWGSFFDGGPGAPYTQAVPTAIAASEGATAVEASNASAYFLLAGRVWAVGDGSQGELGNGTTADAPSTAVQVAFPPGTTIVALGEAKDEGYAIDSTGQGWAWGANGEGSLCIGGKGKQFLPVKVPGMTEALAVKGGEDHVLWLLANGTVKACGINTRGQLGVGTEPSRSRVAIQVPGLTGIVEISAGERTSAARDSKGRLFTWGANGSGNLGLGTVTPAEFTPKQVSLPGPVSQVYAGGHVSENGHTLAIVGGEVFGWGRDDWGDVGDGGSGVRPTPVATGLHFARVAAAGRSSFGLDTEGNVWAFGADRAEALGNGVGIVNQPVPAIVDSGVSMISSTATTAIDG